MNNGKFSKRARVAFYMLCIVLGGASVGCVTPQKMRCMFDWETGVINCSPIVEEIPAKPADPVAAK